MLFDCDKSKEYVLYHPSSDRICLYWFEDGSNNLLYDLDGKGYIEDIENLVFIDELSNN